jgi:uncharacterized membrane protein (UPF0127 family)
MPKSQLSLDGIIILVAKTILGFAVFYFSLFSAPIYKVIQEVGGISQVFKTKEYVVIGDSSLIIETADTKEKRLIGLSNRSNLAANQGMFFVFEEPGYHRIWMKDMNFPIDIIWLNDVKQVVSIKENVTPDTYPESFKPSKESLYVLEVESGFVKKKGIKIGDQLTTFR